MTSRRALYAPLLTSDGDDQASKELPGSEETIVPGLRTSSRKAWLAHLALFFLYSVAFVLLSTRGTHGEGSPDACFSAQSMYSPAHEAIDYSVIKFEGSLEYRSPYKGSKSPVTEAAWKKITTNNSLWPIRVSDDDLQKIMKGGRASNARYKEIDGGGSMATLEIFHQLHCLNLLRKYTYADDYPEVQGLWQTRPKLLRAHLDHCVDIIRQSLMCNADVTIITYDWIGGWEVPFPDFDTYHKCRNFDEILDWMTQNRVHIPQEHMVRISGETDLPEWHPPD